MEECVVFFDSARYCWVFATREGATACVQEGRNGVTRGYGSEPIVGPFESWVKTRYSMGNDFQTGRPAGQFHPRVWRPGNCAAEIIAGGANNVRRSAVAAEILIDKLLGLFRTIEPTAEQLTAYGHEIRNLLLLACMEVESALAAILRANHYPGSRWTTRDYSKLCQVLRLESFAINMHSYPNLPTMTPFLAWDTEKPTASLPWYEAYNATKHDREGNFPRANLQHAISAVAAVVCLLYAQFGPPRHDTSHAWDWELRRVFQLQLEDIFEPQEYYVHFMPRVMAAWNPVDVRL